jgi:hypothetical protein
MMQNWFAVFSRKITWKVGILDWKSVKKEQKQFLSFVWLVYPKVRHKKFTAHTIFLAQNEIFTKEFEGANFIVKNGDYGHILENVVPELAKAKVRFFTID